MGTQLILLVLLVAVLLLLRRVRRLDRRRQFRDSMMDKAISSNFSVINDLERKVARLRDELNQKEDDVYQYVTAGQIRVLARQELLKRHILRHNKAVGRSVCRALDQLETTVNKLVLPPNGVNHHGTSVHYVHR